VREHDYEDLHASDFERPRRGRRFRDEPEPTRRGRLTEGERVRLAQARDDAYTETDLPDGADRWTTWDDADQGPHPRPDEHRLFHRDAGYLEGRRMRRSREMRAMAGRTSFGRNLIAEQWAVAEFAALSRLWTIGAPVPYPVQRHGTELLLEFLGEPDGTAAPRLAQLRPEPDELTELWDQAVSALELLATQGLGHGDLSAYNLLVHEGHLMVIDLPQVVDLVANPRGREFLERDVRNLAGWFQARGLPERVTNAEDLVADLAYAAGLG
jgi:RIO kinase 1